MDPIALALVLAAAGFHAAWNLSLHGTGDRAMSMAVAALVGGLLLAPGIWLSPPWAAWPWLLPSIAAQVGYALALSGAYDRGALSFAYPVGRGTAPLLITLGGWVVLAQAPGVDDVAGAASLILGLVLLTLRAVRVDQAGAVGFALLTGCAIATYSVVDAAAVAEVGPVGYLALVQLGSGLVLLALLRGGVRRGRSSLLTGARIGVGQVTAYLLVLFAFQRASAGPVATVRELSVVLALIVARERQGWLTWTGALLCVGGAALAVW
ncbi:MAG: EamA family transporter [Actinomycetota bacterium]